MSVESIHSIVSGEGFSQLPDPSTTIVWVEYKAKMCSELQEPWLCSNVNPLRIMTCDSSRDLKQNQDTATRTSQNSVQDKKLMFHQLDDNQELLVTQRKKMPTLAQEFERYMTKGHNLFDDDMSQTTTHGQPTRMNTMDWGASEEQVSPSHRSAANSPHFPPRSMDFRVRNRSPVVGGSRQNTVTPSSRPVSRDAAKLIGGHQEHDSARSSQVPSGRQRVVPVQVKRHTRHQVGIDPIEEQVSRRRMSNCASKSSDIDYNQVQQQQPTSSQERRNANIRSKSPKLSALISLVKPKNNFLASMQEQATVRAISGGRSPPLPSPVECDGVTTRAKDPEAKPKFRFLTHVAVAVGKMSQSVNVSMRASSPIPEI